MGKKTIPVKLNRENTWGANDSGKCARSTTGSSRKVSFDENVTIAKVIDSEMNNEIKVCGKRRMINLNLSENYLAREMPGNQQERFKCNLCEDDFASVMELSKHTKRHRKGQLVQDPPKGKRGRLKLILWVLNVIKEIIVGSQDFDPEVISTMGLVEDSQDPNLASTAEGDKQLTDEDVAAAASLEETNWGTQKMEDGDKTLLAENSFEPVPSQPTQTPPTQVLTPITGIVGSILEKAISTPGAKFQLKEGCAATISACGTGANAFREAAKEAAGTPKPQRRVTGKTSPAGEGTPSTKRTKTNTKSAEKAEKARLDAEMKAKMKADMELKAKMAKAERKKQAEAKQAEAQKRKLGDDKKAAPSAKVQRPNPNANNMDKTIVRGTEVLEGKLEEANTTMGELLTTVESLNKQVKEKERDLEEMIKGVEERDDVIDELRKEIKEAREGQASTESKLADQEATGQYFYHEYTTVTEKLQKKEVELEGLQKAQKSWKVNESSLLKQLAEAKQKAGAGDGKEMDEKINLVMGKLQELDSENKKLKKEIPKLKEEKNKLGVDNQAFQKLKADFRNKEECLEEKMTELKEAQTKLKDLRLEYNRQSSELSWRKFELGEQIEKMFPKQVQAGKGMDFLLELRGKVNSLNEAVDSAERRCTEKQEMLQELATTVANLNRDKAGLEKMIANKNNEIKGLKKKVTCTRIADGCNPDTCEFNHPPEEQKRAPAKGMRICKFFWFGKGICERKDEKDCPFRHDRPNDRALAEEFDRELERMRPLVEAELAKAAEKREAKKSGKKSSGGKKVNTELNKTKTQNAGNNSSNKKPRYVNPALAGDDTRGESFAEDREANGSYNGPPPAKKGRLEIKSYAEAVTGTSSEDILEAMRKKYENRTTENTPSGSGNGRGGLVAGITPSDTNNPAKRPGQLQRDMEKHFASPGFQNLLGVRSPLDRSTPAATPTASPVTAGHRPQYAHQNRMNLDGMSQKEKIDHLLVMVREMASEPMDQGEKDESL